MKNLMKDFKDFINRGNLVEIAVAFVLAVAFAAVVKSFVDDVFMNLIAKVIGKDNTFDSLTLWSTILIGKFINAFINFLIIAFVLFLVVKIYNNFKKNTPAEPSEEAKLLIEIRDELRSRNQAP